MTLLLIQTSDLECVRTCAFGVLDGHAIEKRYLIWAAENVVDKLAFGGFLDVIATLRVMLGWIRFHSTIAKFHI